MVVIVREVGEISPARADAPRRGERLIQAHVRRMRRVAQCVNHGDFHAPDFFQRVGGDLLAVAQIGEPFLAALTEQIAVGHHPAMRQGQGNDFQIAQRERPVNQRAVRGENNPSKSAAHQRRK